MFHFVVPEMSIRLEIAKHPLSISGGFRRVARLRDEYYDFIDLRIDNRFSFVEYLSEPVNYPSNVVGGKGFFNLYIPDVETFILEY